MNMTPILDNNFVLLKAEETLHSPLGVVYYKRYKTTAEVEQFLSDNDSKIQAIIGENYIDFGHSQSPKVTDYADGVDTLSFLINLK